MDLKQQIDSTNSILLAGLKAGQEIERLHRKPINRFDYTQIPPHMMERLRAYVDHHWPVGDFLESVICNDLQGAFARADDVNIEIIGVYAAYLYNETPAPCQGSPEKYKAWLAITDQSA